MEHLYDKLKQYAKGDDYPLHMPGHKRRALGAMPPECHAMDVTEIEGFDDLHAPEEIIKHLQERIARLYGADESFCLVNGSTCGILSAVSAAVSEGGRLLMARNCHKSAYHAAYLRHCQITYLMPGVMEEFDVCRGITAAQVRSALKADPAIEAVLIVSPTYEGRISPIREIAGVVHEFGKILIVDEAHGAHLGLAGRRAQAPGAGGEALAGHDLAGRENSCQAGADLVIHSVHKTLPAMTQTALLHVCGNRVDREKLRRFLRIYQSSSPSYVLMASIDNAITLMEQDGERLYGDFCREFREMMRELSACRHFRFLAAGATDGEGGDAAREDKTDLTAKVQDVGKLVIHAGDSGMTGQEIMDVLGEKYHLRLEMAAGSYCLAMFTVGDAPEGYRRLRDALLEMDVAVGSKESGERLRKDRDVADGNSPAESEESAANIKALLPQVAMSLQEAWDAPWEDVPLSNCEGRICAEFVNLYPPGTPIAAPGEIFTKEIVNLLALCRKQGLRLRGVTLRDGEAYVRCLQCFTK